MMSGLFAKTLDVGWITDVYRVSNPALQVLFEEPVAKFVITPNSPVRQIWISALTSSFKLDWSDAINGFVLGKTGESLKPLVARLINEQLGKEAVHL